MKNENTNQIIYKIKNKLPLIGVFSIFIISFSFYNAFMPNANDDLWFFNIMDSRGGFNLPNVFLFVGSRYYSWTSRLGIEFFLVIFVRYPVLFRITNVLISILLLYTFIRITKLFCKDSLILEIFCSLLVLISLLTIQAGNLDAGITATFTNYVWPFAFSLICIYFLFSELYGNKVKVVYKLLSIFFLCLISLWSECVVVFFFIICFAVCIYYFISKKTSWYCLTCLSLCFIFLIFALTCPGNKARIQYDIEKVVPWFAYLTFFDKINRAFFSSFKGYVFCSSVPLIILLIKFIINKHSRFNTSLIVILISINIIYIILYFTKKESIFPVITINWAIAIIMCLIYLCFGYILFKEFKNNIKLTLIILTLYFSSIASLAIVGFSNCNGTLRIIYPMFSLFIIIDAIILGDTIGNLDKTKLTSYNK